jgi:hypothetical protein
MTILRSPYRVILLAALIGLAYTLQVYALNRQDLWGDEAVSALVLKHDAAQILAGQVDPFHPPLYFLLLRGWTRLAGGTEFAIRYLSLMGMLIGVAFIGRAAGAALDSSLALFALILAAVAPFMVYYAQEARMYGVAMAFNAGALWAAIAAVRRANLPTQKGFCPVWIAFALLALGTVYAHYLSFLHLLGIAFGLFIAWARQWRKLALAACTAIAMGLVYLPWALMQMNRTRGQFPFRPEVWTLAELGRVLQDTLQAFSIGQTPAAKWEWGVVGLMVCVAALGAIEAIRSRKPERWLASVIVITVLGVGWLFNAYLFAFEPRYLMMGMPAYLLLIALGLRGISQRWPSATGIVLAVILVAAGFSNHTYYTQYRKGNYGLLMRTVQANAQPGDVLLLNNPLQRASFAYYQPANISYHYLMRDVILDPDRLDAALSELTRERKRVWLVMFGDPNEYDPEFRVEHWLATRGAKNYYQGFGDSTLAMYVMASAANTTIPAAATFGEQIALTGYRLNANAVQPGDTLIVELDWQALAQPAHDYTVFVQLLNPDGTLLAQVDTQPVGGTRPTSQWAIGETVSDRYALLIPSNTLTGQGQLIVGLYLWPAMVRLPITGANLPIADNALHLTTITLSSP